MKEIPQYILIVEDDPILKNILGHTFTGKYQTVYASDGNEAMEFFDKFHPVLILLDLMLPTVNGFAVLQKLRAREDAGKTVPIIIFSNLGQESDREKAKSLGATAYLVKAEVDIEEIMAKIEEILSQVPPVPSAQTVLP